MRLLHTVDTANEWIGRGVAWLILCMLLVQFTIVLMRYVSGLSSLVMHESITYLHAAVFMLAVGYGLRHEAHVRIDILYRRFRPRVRAVVNVLGVLLLLLPVCVVLLLKSLQFVVNSWATLESSTNMGGIPAVYLLKSLIPLFALLLALQGLVLLMKSLATFARLPHDSDARGPGRP